MLDISRLVRRRGRDRLPTGVDRVGLAYVRHLGPRAQAVLQWKNWRRIVPFRQSQQLFELLLEPPEHFRAATAAVIASACLPPWPPQEGRGRLYLNVNHAGIEAPALTKWLAATKQRPVYFVHDLIPLTHPEYCRPGDAQRHAQRLRTVLRTARALVTNSEATLTLVRRFAESEGLPLPRSAAAPIAPAPLHRPVAGSRPLPVPYFVMLGTIEPRKNHLLVLHASRDLVERKGAAAPHLVVIGQRGWECENIVDLLDRCASLRGHVHELSGCGDDVLADYLGHAQALLFPSFAEGYGMPLVEALSLGTPVLANDLPAFREVAGDVPDYLHPLDGPAWMQAVLDYADPGGPRRAAQLQRMRGWRAPTWEDHFRRVACLMESLG